jgi:hypothetical protein
VEARVGQKIKPSGGSRRDYGQAVKTQGQLNGAPMYRRKERSSPIDKSARGGMKTYGHTWTAVLTTRAISGERILDTHPRVRESVRQGKT